MRSIDVFINLMKVYGLRTKSEVDIQSWVNKMHVLTDTKGYNYFKIISYYMYIKVVI